MKWSKSFINTYREAPSDAEIISHQLLVRGDFIRKVAPGIYTYGSLGLRALTKFAQIVREELTAIDSQEILMPIVHPKELWQESGRWETATQVGLLKFKNRNDQEFCLGPTHEEVVTDYVRHQIKSYRDLPVSLFQIQTKYRDEIRPRFGLMRCREFLMKDAYTFDADSEGALKSYDYFYSAYSKIFSRLGLKFVVVEADAGNIGGSKTQEFQVLAEAGEDHLLVCQKCNFAANIEVAPVTIKRERISSGSPAILEKFETPGQKTIADLAKFTKSEEKNLVKTLFFSASMDPTKDLKPVAVLLRGSDELNPIKLKSLLGLDNPPLMLTDSEVKSVTGAMPGSCGPVGLKIPIYMDQDMCGMSNFIVGANEDDFHLKNVNIDRDFKVTKVADLRTAKEKDACPNCDGKFKSFRGIEVGHIFNLGTVYTKKLKAEFLDSNGKSHPLEMGCYGIGISRTVQAAVEQSHDKDGIVWPLSIAPFPVHICVLDPDKEEILKVAESIYVELKSLGIEALMDDRHERPGVKFKDADLLGMPLRLVIGKRGVDSGKIEVVERKSKEKKEVELNQVVSFINEWVEKETNSLEVR